MSEKSQLFNPQHVLNQKQLDIEQSVRVPVESGPKEQLWRVIDSTSQGNSEASFAFQVPTGTIIDRRMYVSADIEYTLTSTNTSGADVAAGTVNDFNADFPLTQNKGEIMPGAFPLHQTMSSLQVSINTVAMAESMSKFADTLRLYDDQAFIDCAHICPTMQDNSSSYNDYLVNSVANNPLLASTVAPNRTGLAALPDQIPNNGFPIGVAGDLFAADPWAAGDANGSTKTGTITYSGFEPLMHPALDFSGKEQGLLCNDFAVKINWSPSPRAFRVNPHVNQTFSLALSNVSNVKLHLRTMVQSELAAPLMRQVLPIHQFQLSQANPVTVPAGQQQQIYSPVLNTGRMPKAVLVYCPKASRSCQDTDYSLVLKELTCQIGSKTQQIGLSSQNLYLMSKDNLKRASAYYNDFIGNPKYVGGSPGVGSFALYRFGKDIVLPSNIVSGSAGSFQCSMIATYQNRGTAAVDAQFNCLYIFDDAIVTDMASKSSTLQSTLLSPSAVAEALSNWSGLEYEDEFDVMGMYGGSWKSFWRGFKKVAKPLGRAVRGIQEATGLGGPVGNLVSKGLKAVGAGKGEDHGDMFY